MRQSVAREQEQYDKLTRNRGASDEQKADAKYQLDSAIEDLQWAEQDFAADYPATGTGGTAPTGLLGFLQNPWAAISPGQPGPIAGGSGGWGPGTPGGSPQPHMAGLQPVAPGPGGGDTNIDLSNHQTVSNDANLARETHDRHIGTSMNSSMLNNRQITT